MNYEIILYDAKVVPLKTAVCKIIFSEDQTRNRVGVVFHRKGQVADLINQLRVYENLLPESDGGMA